MRSSQNHQSRIESVTGTWCVYVVYNPDRSKVYVGTTRDLKVNERKKKGKTP
jgi:predicted GIY-YIG superfamily endonuclease